MKSEFDIFSGPYPLEEQRRQAESAGFEIVPAPDAPRDGEAQPDFDASARSAGAAVFVRDYNLPVHPESRVLPGELEAPARIVAARGQTEPLSLGVHALEDLEGLTVECGPLLRADGAALPAPRVRVLEQAWVCDPDRPEEKRAMLAHLRLWPNRPVELAAGLNRQFWLDLAVPEGAEPGEYRGSIRVGSSGRPAVSRLLTAVVRPYRLREPRDFFLGAFMTLRPFIPDRETLADFKAHGIDAMLWFYSPTVWTLYRNGDSIRQNFHPLVRIVEDSMAVGMRGPIVIALGDDTVGYYEREICRQHDRPLRPASPVDGKTAQVAALDDETVNRLYVEGLRQLLEMARERNWPEVVLLHYDEPTERLMPEAAHRYKLIKDNFPEVRVYGVTMNTLEWARDLVPVSDILVCNGSFAEIRELARKEGKDAWGYGGSPASVGAGGARFNMGLRLWQHRFGSHWFWCYNFYRDDPWNEFDGGGGDAGWVTVYPGTHAGGHIPTLAWEGIRAGYEDLRYCATLEHLLEAADGPSKQKVAAEYEEFLAAIPSGRDRTSFGLDQDSFYATLPNYNRLTEMRSRLTGWIDRLLAEANHGRIADVR